MPNTILAQKELKELLHYNPETGLFTRKVSLSNRVKIGDIAGSINSSGYIAIRVRGNPLSAHRLAWLYVHGVWPENEIDHINQNRADNRLINLREVTGKENHKNMSLYKANTSGVCGVNWNRKYSKWHSRINVDGKSVWLGQYDDKFEAICSRMSAKNKYGFHENHGT